MLDLAAQLYQDPYDRSRPLRYFVLVDGLEGGRSALVSKMHHSLADGIAGLRLSELYVDGRRDAPDPPAVDLDAVIAQTPPDVPAKEDDSVVTAATCSPGTPRRQLGISRRMAGEVADVGCRSTAPARPRRRCSRTGAAAPRPGDGARSGELSEGDHRCGPTFVAPALRDAARPARCGAGDRQGARADRQHVLRRRRRDGALAYHDKRQASVEALNISFVVSTRQDSAIGGNAFTPTPAASAPGAWPMPSRGAVPPAARGDDRQAGRGARRRVDVVDGRRGQPAADVGRHPRRVIAEREDGLRHQQPARCARPLYMCGAEVIQNIPIGPVAGTAFNITTVSYNGSLDIGLAIDP